MMIKAIRRTLPPLWFLSLLILLWVLIMVASWIILHDWLGLGLLADVMSYVLAFGGVIAFTIASIERSGTDA